MEKYEGERRAQKIGGRICGRPCSAQRHEMLRELYAYTESREAEKNRAAPEIGPAEPGEPCQEAVSAEMQDLVYIRRAARDDRRTQAEDQHRRQGSYGQNFENQRIFGHPAQHRA